MKSTNKKLASAAERALKITEILDPKRYPIREVFKKSRKEIQLLLSEADVNSSYIPNWALLLREMSEFIDSSIPERGKDEYNFIDLDIKIPFEEILCLVVVFARQKLRDRFGKKYYAFSTKLHTAFERELLQRLSKLCSPLLYEYFLIDNRKSARSDLLFSQKTPRGNNEKYLKFVNLLAQGKFGELIYEYPVLGRLVSTTIEQWVTTTHEFLFRVEKDKEMLQNFFQSTKNLSIIDVNVGISDLHNSGRRVIVVVFNDGEKIVYKPRNLSVEKSFSSFINWINTQEETKKLRALEIIDCDTYGWVEFIEHRPLTTKAETQSFYERTGMLLAILYILDATDFHAENIIAHREFPVLVDLETLMHPTMMSTAKQGESLDAHRQAQNDIHTSVLKSGLLPRWAFGNTNYQADYSGLGNTHPQTTPVKIHFWENINTDSMSVDFKLWKTPPHRNVSLYEEKVQDPSSYMLEIERGFVIIYDLFLKNKITDLDSPISTFQAKKHRIILRDTLYYQLLLEKSLKPRKLRSGIERSLTLNPLFDKYVEDEKYLHVALEEIEHLENLNIPAFYSRTDSKHLFSNGQIVVADFFEETAYSRLKKQVGSLSEKDKMKQVSLLRRSLFSYKVREPNESNHASNKFLGKSMRLDRDDFVQEAILIEKSLDFWAIKSSKTITWQSLSYTFPSGKYQIQPINFDLYGGLSGVGVFYAALYKITENRKYLDNLSKIVNQIGIFLSDIEPSQIRHLHGGGVGLSSIIYSLCKIQEFSNHFELMRIASNIADFFSEHELINDNNHDLLSGSAGTILCLLELYRNTKNILFLEKAKIAGFHLAKSRRLTKHNYKSWYTLDNKPLTGFSHGAAGIAYSLLRLHKITGVEIYQSAAIEAIKYERSTYSAIEKNWPDYRIDTKESRFMNSWCHGASGIGLARIGSYPYFTDTKLADEISVAVGRSREINFQGVDTLCCGNFGRTETLLSFSIKTKDKKLYTIAQEQASHLILHKRKLGSFKLYSNLPRYVFSPEFFQGVSGIGYQLLRLYNPKKLPSILLWE
jgi:type 2 lantibiotic biosynthesis protein LanM